MAEDPRVRVVNRLIAPLDLAPRRARSTGGGTSRYHPQRMLQVLGAAYTQRLYSSQQSAKALRENIHFRWRSGRNQPDVRTLPAFRRKTLKPVLAPVFGAGGEYRVAEGDAPLEHSFLDGTQSAAHANKHQGVWAKRNRKPPERWPAKSQELLAQIEAANAAEPAASGDRDREENGGKKGPGSWFNAAQLRAKIAERNEKLSAPSPEVPPGPAQRKALRSLEPDGLPRQQK